MLLAAVSIYQLRFWYQVNGSLLYEEHRGVKYSFYFGRGILTRRLGLTIACVALLLFILVLLIVSVQYFPEVNERAASNSDRDSSG